MQKRFVIPPAFILALLLSGCAGSRESHATPPAMSQEEQSRASHYAEEIRQAVMAAFPDARPYEGKKCTVEMKITRDGMLLSARPLSGDPILCREAVSAMSRAKIPPAPDEETGHRLARSVLDFAP